MVPVAFPTPRGTERVSGARHEQARNRDGREVRSVQHPAWLAGVADSSTAPVAGCWQTFSHRHGAHPPAHGPAAQQQTIRVHPERGGEGLGRLTTEAINLGARSGGRRPALRYGKSMRSTGSSSPPPQWPPRCGASGRCQPLQGEKPRRLAAIDHRSQARWQAIDYELGRRPADLPPRFKIRPARGLSRGRRAGFGGLR